MAEEVRAGLTGPGPKRLPSHLLYDDLGSSLFEAITRLPEYGLTRADERILTRHARDLASAVPTTAAVAELGSGTGRKTRWVLEAVASAREVRYLPIDLSSSALARCRAELSDLERVRIEPIAANYLEGLERAVREAGGGDSSPLLVLFLGSTIGNFEPREGEEFLGRVRRLLRSGDSLLLGTDLVQSPSRLIRAYDDELGVTAAFNRNLLVRLNRELDAGFDVSRFEHEARWNEADCRVEMHLVAREAMRVRIGALGITAEFEPGETIWTESSYKFGPADPAAMGARAGFTLAEAWTDEEWPFAETLLRVP